MMDPVEAPSATPNTSSPANSFLQTEVHPKSEKPEDSSPRLASPPPGTTKFCATCDKPTGLGCSKCQNISYCSVACQTADWPYHMPVCWQFHIFQDADRPTPWHIRAVIFPVRGPRPRFIWLRMTGQYTRDTAKYLGDDNFVEKQTWHNIACRTRPVNSQPLYFYSIYPSCPSYAHRLPNASIPTLCSPPARGVSFPWRGTVIATGEYGDLNMRDFRAAVDFLQAFPKNLALMDPTRYQGPTAVEGVKLNCDDAVARYGVERLQPVKLTEHMLAENSPSRLDVVPSLALIVRFAPGPSGGGRRALNPHGLLAVAQERLLGRKAAGWMSVDEVTTLRGGGCALGSMVVHRADKRPLLPAHVVALEEFVCESARLVADARGRVWRDSIALHLTRVDFEEFWKGFVERLRREREDELEDVSLPPSPFDV